MAARSVALATYGGRINDGFSGSYYHTVARIGGISFTEATQMSVVWSEIRIA